LALKQKQSLPSEGLITALSIGGFLITLGIIFSLTPDLPQKIDYFFRSLTTVQFPFQANTGSGIMMMPAPANPAAHSLLYEAVMQFTIGIGILQVAILALRAYFHSPVSKTSETVGNMGFWFGTAYLVDVFLKAGTRQSWFEFWASLIVVVGISFLARAMVYLSKR
jgi:hypothetical protein